MIDLKDFIDNKDSEYMLATYDKDGETIINPKI